MTRALLVLSGILLAAPFGAQAAGAAPAHSGVAAAFGNTVITTDPDGRTRKVWLKADGTWTGRSRRGLDLAGAWKEKDGKVCMSQSKPRLLGSLCQPFPTDPKVGIDTKDPLGKKVHITLVKGHVDK
jgi:hypothetical protein